MANFGMYKIKANNGWVRLSDLIGTPLVGGAVYVLQNRSANALLVCAKTYEPVDDEGFEFFPGRPMQYTHIDGEELYIKSKSNVDSFINVAE